jgi:hypothetical protein
MNLKTLLGLWAVVAVASALTAWIVLTRETAPPTRKSAAAPAGEPAVSVDPVPVTATPPLSVAPPEGPRPNRVPAPVEKNAIPSLPEVVEAPAADPRFEDPVFKEQLGRYALSYVGADPMADEVWTWLVYDTSLPDKVREDLMEDLNENGFSDGNGRRATMDDLPLIESRLALLEEHLAGADEFMLVHLAEAYKDLANMWFRLNRE